MRERLLESIKQLIGMGRLGWQIILLGLVLIHSKTTQVIILTVSVIIHSKTTQVIIPTVSVIIHLPITQV